MFKSKGPGEREAPYW